MLRNIHGLACWLIDSRIPLQGAQFPFAPPPHRDVYGVLFSGPTAFDTAPAGIHFDARYLALPLRRDEAALKQMLQRALPLTVLQYRRDRLLVQRVRQALAAHPGATHSAENLAALLNVSARTLHRQLKEEGASLQALKDEVRRTRALELLLRTHRPIKQVAEAAGFQNEKSFMRAFRGWTGQSPAEFRRCGHKPSLVGPDAKHGAMLGGDGFGRRQSPGQRLWRWRWQRSLRWRMRTLKDIHETRLKTHRSRCDDRVSLRINDVGL